MNFDDLLTQEAHEDGAEMNVLNPRDGEATDFFITIMGADSRAFQRAQKKLRNEAVAILSAGKKISEDDELNQDIDHMVAVTIGWRGLEDEKGKDQAFTRESAKELYQKSPSVRYQVERFVSDRRNFIKG